MSDKRVTVTVKLRPGKDDDLIAWWLNLPKGDFETDGRQSIIKAALRDGLQYPQPHVETNGELDPAALEHLRDEIYQEWQEWTQKLIDSLPTYVQGEVEKAIHMPHVPDSPPPVEATDQLDSQTANERKSRLRGANW